MFVICHLKEWQAQSYTTTSRCESGCSYRMHGDKWQDTTDAKKETTWWIEGANSCPISLATD